MPRFNHILPFAHSCTPNFHRNRVHLFRLLPVKLGPCGYDFMIIPHTPILKVLFGSVILLLLFGFASLIRIMSVRRQWATARGIHRAVLAATTTHCRWNVNGACSMPMLWICRVSTKCIKTMPSSSSGSRRPHIMHLFITHRYKFIVSSVNRVSTVRTAALAGSNSHTEGVLRQIRNWYTCKRKQKRQKTISRSNQRQKGKSIKTHRDIIVYLLPSQPECWNCITFVKLFASSSTFLFLLRN